MRKGGRNRFWLDLVTRNQILVVRPNQNHSNSGCMSQPEFVFLVEVSDQKIHHFHNIRCITLRNGIVNVAKKS